MNQFDKTTERFFDLCEKMWFKRGTDQIWEDLLKHYNESHRTYHNLDHIEFGLSQLDMLREYPDWLEFAWWMHDVIYEIGSEENELLSSSFARHYLQKAGIPQGIRGLVTDAIMCTLHDTPPRTYEQKLMVDIDLATLGLPRKDFSRYQLRIHDEYPDVSDTDFWIGHNKVLKKFIDRPTIYYSDFFWNKYEEIARDNIKWSLHQ